MRQEPECKIGMVGASGGVTTLATDIVSGMWDTWVHLTLPHGRGWGEMLSSPCLLKYLILAGIPLEEPFRDLIL